MAATGGRVLALRSVEFARNHRVPLHVRSSFTWEPGTWVTEEDHAMEEPIISGVTHDVTEAKVTVHHVPDRPGIAARLFRALADAGVNVDMIVQNTSIEGSTDISFTAPKADRAVAEKIVGEIATEIGAGGVSRRRRHRQGEPRRLGDEDEPRHRRHHVRDAGGQRREHRDDLDVDHPHHLRGGPLRHGERRCAASTPRSGWTAASEYAAPLPERR